MSRETNLTFYIQNHPIGDFRSTPRYPSDIGWHPYEPCRGTGHAILAETLRNGDTLTAWFFDRGTKRHFEVDKESFDAKRIGNQWQIHILRFSEDK